MRDTELAVRPSSFMSFNNSWSRWFFSHIAHAYDRVHHLSTNAPWLGSRIWNSEFVFFVIATAFLFFLFPRYSVIAWYAFEKYLIGHQVPWPDISRVPYTPNDLVVFLLIFLATYHIGGRIRFWVFFAVSFVLLWLSGRIDILSLVIGTTFLLLVYGLIRLQLKRSVTIPCICALSVGFMLLCSLYDKFSTLPIRSVALFQAGLLPMLWYSVYEEQPPKKQLGLLQFFTYIYLRFFQAPVTAYREVFPTKQASISAVRFGGIKALYVTAYANLAVWGIEHLMESTDVNQLFGASLIGFSYLIYVHDYCQIVIIFNTVIGVLRLFGVPIGDNFNYWLFARTPNEHWRRWNMLLREWVITFVFFPIMRAKRWLFVAVMAALGTSGALHMAPLLLPQKFDAYRTLAVATYWILNGLAIYLVIKIPLVMPKTMKRLGVGSRRIWDVVGIILTSVFYAILTFARDHIKNSAELMEYLGRIFAT